MAEGNDPDDVESDYLGVLLLGRTGQGKSTTGNKLLKAAGESVLRDNQIEEFKVGGGGESVTHQIRSVYRPPTEDVKAVQVIDTGGFADSDTSVEKGVYRANLAIFRDLIMVQINQKLRIHRVLYFLPSRGPLERADAVLQEEIRVMHHFFGNAIFDCMVLVATHHKRKQSFGFDEEDCEDTRRIFMKAVELAFKNGGQVLKCPPVLFIGLNDTGREVLLGVESAAVVRNEGLTLDKFVKGCCTRCAARYLCHEGNPNDLENRIGVEVETEDREQDDDEEIFVPYESSRCHPLIIPKYSFWEKVVGGAAYIATLGIPMMIQKLRKREIPWPTFTSDDEMCDKCKKNLGSEGCTEIGTKCYAILPTDETIEIIVNHTNLLEDGISRFLMDVKNA